MCFAVPPFAIIRLANNTEEPAMDIDFLPETRQAIRNIVGSWRLSGLELSPETIREMELCALGKMSHDEAVNRAIQRAMQDE